jgi:multidrug resistance efflux pump
MTVRTDEAQSQGVPTTADLIDRLSHFDGPPEQFLINLLAVQCYLSAAGGGAILRGSNEGVQVVAVYPPLPEGATAPVWLAQAVELAPEAAKAGGTAIRPLRTPHELYGAPASQHLILLPIRAGGQSVRGVGAFFVEARDAGALAAARERLELTISLLSFYEMRLTLQRRQQDLGRIRLAMETLAAVNEHDHFAGAGMALCNELSSRLQCDRVALGFLKGRYVALKALSHTEKFSRKMKLVQDIEAAMEECLDQDVEVVQPASAEATYVSRAHKELATRHGPTSILSLPLRRAGAVVAVVTLERPADRPFALEEVEALRLVGDLCTARVANLHEHDRWVGARMAAATRKGLAAVVGPKHTWAKVLAIAVLAAAALLTFVKGDYNAEGTFAFQAVERRVVPAPFEGYLRSVQVEPGDFVRKGQQLAELDDSQLKSERAAKEAARLSEEQKAKAAWRDDKRADAVVAEREAQKLAAEVDLLNDKISKAIIVAPIDGTVITGDLKRQIGAKVETGNMLFEVAPLEALRAELSIPEDQIAEVALSQKGELATATYPDRRIEFQVERINPVAEVVKDQNVFKVRATLPPDLLKEHSWARPGMEGVAKVHLGRKPYGELWTRKLVNWVRMQLWI